jgi:hypothetical protein
MSHSLSLPLRPEGTKDSIFTGFSVGRIDIPQPATGITRLVPA